MAPAVRAEVALVSLKNCLVNLPPGLIALISNTNIVRLPLTTAQPLIPADPIVASSKCRRRATIQISDIIIWGCVEWKCCRLPKIRLCWMDWHAEQDSPRFSYQQ